MVRKLTVRRKAYRRKSYVKDVIPGPGVKMKRIKASRVKAATFQIRDIGLPGRGKKLIKVKKGLLRELGYSTGLSPAKRRIALKKADRKFGSQRLFRMLQAQVILRKRTQPMARKIFVADRNWVRKNLISKAEALAMTRPARKKWIGMSPAARARAMPSRKQLNMIT